MTTFEVGDRVRYSVAFLRNTGQQTGDVPFLRGLIDELLTIGEQVIAVVDFGDGDTQKVLTVNLAKETPVGWRTLKGIDECS